MRSEPYQGIIHRYWERLPIDSKDSVVTLLEGNTPLVPLNNIMAHFNKDIKLWAKFEGSNPSGSFKDRGMTLAISKAVESGGQAVICASTGNTSASAAAYAARAKIPAFVIIPKGNIALGKLAQALIHGAHVIEIDGNFDQGMALVKEISETLEFTLVNSINPYRLEGQKTAAFEIMDTLGDAPDFHYISVGNAANIVSYWRGYQEYFHDEKVKTRPKMVGYQASGAAPFVHQAFVDDPQTLATAIRIGHPQSWDLANSAVRDSKGWFNSVTDDVILAAQGLLAAEEGLFCEPASAAALAGVLRDIEEEKVPNESHVVCTLSGHGLKDPQVAISQFQDQILKVRPHFNELKNTLLKKLEEER